MDMHLGRSRQGVDLDVTVWNGRGPEEPVALGIDGRPEARVKVVRLSREVYKVKLTLIGVESDEREGAEVETLVHAPVHALHEAQVSVPEKGVAATIFPRTFEVGHADEADEVGDRDWLVTKRWCGICWAGKIRVLERLARQETWEAAWNGQRRHTWQAAALQEFNG
jgi:hypothetical protein